MLHLWASAHRVATGCVSSYGQCHITAPPTGMTPAGATPTRTMPLMPTGYLLHPLPLQWHPPHLAWNLATMNKQTQSTQMMISIIWASGMFLTLEFFFLLTNLILFLGLIMATHPTLHHPSELPPVPRCCFEPLLAGWQWLLFPDYNGCHITQQHHPACEPLLIGGNGGMDNEGWADRWQGEDNDSDEDVEEGADKWQGGDGKWHCRDDKQQHRDNMKGGYNKWWGQQQMSTREWCSMPHKCKTGCLFFSSFFCLLLATFLLSFSLGSPHQQLSIKSWQEN